MLFSELMKSELPEDLIPDVTKLLDLKMNASEVKMISRIDRINEYVDRSIAEIKMILQLMDEKKEVEWRKLNDLFLKIVQG